jgi:hypothetical protein
MKRVPQVLFIGALTVWTALAAAAPVNDTGTAIVSKAGDCGVINPVEAYFTLFGDRGGAGKALFIRAEIKNWAFLKTVSIVHENGQSATAENTTNPVALRIAYRGSVEDRDQAELLDLMVGPPSSGSYRLSVTMNGTTSTCLFKVDKN